MNRPGVLWSVRRRVKRAKGGALARFSTRRRLVEASKPTSRLSPRLFGAVECYLYHPMTWGLQCFQMRKRFFQRRCVSRNRSIESVVELFDWRIKRFTETIHGFVVGTLLGKGHFLFRRGIDVRYFGDEKPSLVAFFDVGAPFLVGAFVGLRIGDERFNVLFRDSFAHV